MRPTHDPSGARGRRYEDSEQRTTFADVAGISEATEELAEVVDFLKWRSASINSWAVMA
jgi:ATP-dependent Zn protease